MPPQPATVDAGTGLSTGSTGSSWVTLRAAVARATKSGTGGTAARPTQTAAMAAKASMVERTYAWRHVSAPRSRNTGIIATAVTAAAPSRARMGRMPRSGSATLRAAKMEKASSAWLSQRRGDDGAYQGSTAVRAPRHDAGETQHVRRVERRARPVGGEHEEQEAVVEGLYGVVRGADDTAPAATLERSAQLRDEGEEQPQEQQVADDPAHVGQPAPEDEDRRKSQAERDDGDSPALDPVEETGAHAQRPPRERRRRQASPEGNSSTAAISVSPSASMYT
jgi:hypothetical protein